MTSRYRVDYYLKEHRRDEFIEWIKSLLATPFVLYPVNPNKPITNVEELVINADAFRRYADVFKDIERLVEGHKADGGESRLAQLVPSIGTFFTSLPLERAFYIQDQARSISKRRLVAPSFNDIRLILNTAQLLALTQRNCRVKLITFDGDITLYEDGMNFPHDSPLLDQMIGILVRNIVVGIVTAAGYSNAEKYYERLGGLVDGIKASERLNDTQRENFLVMGGESNFLFRLNASAGQLEPINEAAWKLPAMKQWAQDDVEEVLNFAQSHLGILVEKLGLPAMVIRKERAVGLIAEKGHSLIREQLEEVVLRVDHNLRMFEPAQRIKWCAFNGGSDVWVDIGDKSLGVKVLQEMLMINDGLKITPANTLHVGDQFASLGSNDYASRTAATTAWISSPTETNGLLQELLGYLDEESSY